MMACDEAYLWHVEPDRLEPSRVRALLTDAEHERARTIRRSAGQRRYVVARALVRTALAEHTGVAPRTLVFRRTAHGRPEVVAPEATRGLCFSLSHTRGLIACLVARTDAGVDVERRSRRVAALRVAERYFTPAEIRQLRGLPAACRTESFLKLWTLKEAYLKARGLGFAGGLDALSAIVSAGELTTHLSRDDARHWQVGFADVSPDHIVAYALRGDGVRVRACSAERAMR